MARTFNARLEESDLKKFARKAKRQGLSQTALLRQWIRSAEIPTAADAITWERRNEGNVHLHITRG